MKKACMILFVILIVVSLSITGFADDANTSDTITYRIKEFRLSVEIPSDFIVFTRDIKDNDPNLEKVGITRESLLKSMNDGYLYLIALEPYSDYEIDIQLFTSTAEEYNTKDDATLLAEAATWPSTGLTVSSQTVYSQKQIKFIKQTFTRNTSSGIQYEQQFNSVCNKTAISVRMKTRMGPIHEYMDMVQQRIADSVTFDITPKVTPTPQEVAASSAKKPGSHTATQDSLLSSIVFGLILTIFLYSLPIVIYRYGIKKSPVEKKKAKKITIVYGLLAFLGMSALLLVTNGNVAGGGPIVFWSWINYKMLTGGKKADQNEKDELGTSATVNKNQLEEDSSQLAIETDIDKQNEDPSLRSSHGIIYDVVLDDGSSAVMDEKELTEYVARKKTQQELTSIRQRNAAETSDLTESLEQILFCRECGKRLAPEAVFCPECGTKVLVSHVAQDGQPPEEGALSETKLTEASSIVEEAKPAQWNLGDNIKKLSPTLRRAFMLVEDGEWEKADGYFERVLDEEPENAYAYLGKLMIEKQASEIEALTGIPDLKNNKLFARAVQYADEKLGIVLQEI